MDVRAKLLLTFAVYIAALFIFAWRYYRIYLQSPSSFLFAENIRDSKKIELQPVLTAGMNEKTREIEVLKHLLEILARVESLDGLVESREMFLLASGNSYSIVKRSKWYPDSVPGPAKSSFEVIWYQAEYVDFSGKVINVFNLGGQLTRWETWSKRITKLLKKSEASYGGYKKRILSFSEYFPEIWTFWDFLYFSVISQTTVGYGDILPNRTSIRMLVVAQIIIGYAILVVVLNLILA